jgi:hypothetical protein
MHLEIYNYTNDELKWILFILSSSHLNTFSGHVGRTCRNKLKEKFNW